MTYVDCLDLHAQELGSVLKSEQREALELLKKLVDRQHTTFTLCQNAACSNELFSLSGRLCFGGKRFD